jgi:HSP20 family molecular chaperone IbpA
MADKGITKKNYSGDLFNSDNKVIKSKYDFLVKMGLNEKDAEFVKNEPEITVPRTDVFKEGKSLIVILEMPDITLDDFSYRIESNTLYVEGKGKNTIYKKDIDLGSDKVIEDCVELSENNGFFKFILHLENKIK